MTPQVMRPGRTRKVEVESRMRINAAYYSSVGGRQVNEDSVSIQEYGDAVLGIVADGLGGHADGELASKLAVDTLNARIRREQVSAAVLRGAIDAANQAIWHDNACNGMKSTVASVWFNQKQALVGTVGDTRVYQIRRGQIVFQSRDHSVTQLAVLAGEMDARSIRGSKDRNKLLRALGAQEEVRADVTEIQILRGDALLLCSDGFWENVWEEEMIYDLVNTGTVKEWLRTMRRRVYDRAGTSGDNHTAIAIQIR